MLETIGNKIVFVAVYKLSFVNFHWLVPWCGTLEQQGFIKSETNFPLDSQIKYIQFHCRESTHQRKLWCVLSRFQSLASEEFVCSRFESPFQYDAAVSTSSPDTTKSSHRTVFAFFVDKLI